MQGVRGGREGADTFQALEMGVGSQALGGCMHCHSSVGATLGPPPLCLLCHLCWLLPVLDKVCKSAVKAPLPPHYPCSGQLETCFPFSPPPSRPALLLMPFLLGTIAIPVQTMDTAPTITRDLVPLIIL